HDLRRCSTARDLCPLVRLSALRVAESGGVLANDSKRVFSNRALLVCDLLGHKALGRFRDASIQPGEDFPGPTAAAHRKVGVPADRDRRTERDAMDRVCRGYALIQWRDHGPSLSD